jgi:hypothetical protein
MRVADAPSDLMTSLMWASEVWEITGYVATAFVVVGVAGESVCQLTEWIKSIPLRHKVEVASALVLIGALAGEILTQVESNSTNSLIVGILNKEAADSNLALEQLRQKVGQRRIDQQAFSSRIADTPKQSVQVVHASDDPDSYLLAHEILGLLDAADWKPSYLGHTAENFKWCGAQLGGVLVLSKEISQDELADINKPPKERSSAWLALTDALHRTLNDGAGFATCPFVPKDTLLIVVSPKLIFFPK